MQQEKYRYNLIVSTLATIPMKSVFIAHYKKQNLLMWSMSSMCLVYIGIYMYEYIGNNIYT